MPLLGASPSSFPRSSVDRPAVSFALGALAARGRARGTTHMKAMQKITLLPDVQSRVDERELPIDAVGIRSVRIPITVHSGWRTQPTIATLAMTVALPAIAKGTHMSRFVELLEEQTEALDQPGFQGLVY